MASDWEASIRRLRDSFGNTRGVAFSVPILDKARPGSFWLTAAHALGPRSGWASLQLEESPGATTFVEVLACTQPTEELDLAVLYTQEGGTRRIRCLDESRSSGSEVLVRGSPLGSRTMFSNFHGRLSGLEQVNGAQYLDITLSDYGPIESRPSATTLPGLEDEDQFARPFEGCRGHL